MFGVDRFCDRPAELHRHAARELNVQDLVCNEVTCHANQIERRECLDQRSDDFGKGDDRTIFGDRDLRPRIACCLDEPRRILADVERTPRKVWLGPRLAEVMFRDARSRLITEGSSEMQRMIIAGDLLSGRSAIDRFAE